MFFRPHMMLGFARRALPLLTFLLVACRQADSSTSDATAARFTIDPSPLITLADDDASGEPQLGEAVSVVWLDSTMLVADRGLFALRWFGSDGALVRSVGREGSGPGEFGYLLGLHRCGDSLYVGDIVRQQTMVFSLDGELTRSELTNDMHGGRLPYHSACNSSGTFVHYGWDVDRDQTPGRVRWQVPFWISRPDGSVVAELGVHAGSERLMLEGGSSPHPMGKEPLLAIGSSRAYIGTADSFAVLAYTFAGELAGVLRAPDGDLRTSKADIDRFLHADTIGKSQLEREWLARDRRNIEYPPTVPAYDAMRVDALDHVWVRRFPRGTDTAAEWVVFTPDGTLLTTVALPIALEVHDIGPDYVAGIETDLEMGEQSVTRYRLQRAAGP